MVAFHVHALWFYGRISFPTALPKITLKLVYFPQNNFPPPPQNNFTVFWFWVSRYWKYISFYDTYKFENKQQNHKFMENNSTILKVASEP